MKETLQTDIDNIFLFQTHFAYPANYQFQGEKEKEKPVCDRNFLLSKI